MIEGIEVVYQQIADTIVQLVPEPWREATVEVVCLPGGMHFEGTYRSEAGKLRGFATSKNCHRAFRELRRKFEEAGQPIWGQAHFVLYSDGKFNMKWGYENCDANGDTLYDDEAWARRQEKRRLWFLREAT